MTIGLLNDNEFLYVSLTSADPARRTQAMMAGLTVWFDPKGGKDEWFGIEFPTGMDRSEMQSRGEPGGRGGRGGGAGRGGDPQSRRRMMDEAMTYLAIIGPGELGRRRVRVERDIGIDVRLGRDPGTFVYELKVPLSGSAEHPYGIGAEPGMVIGVGIETGSMSAMRPGGIGGPGGGGFGGRGGGGFGGRGGGGTGGRGGMGRGGTGNRPDAPDELKVWAKVQLSTRPQSADRSW